MDPSTKPFVPKKQKSNVIMFVGAIFTSSFSSFTLGF